MVRTFVGPNLSQIGRPRCRGCQELSRMVGITPAMLLLSKCRKIKDKTTISECHFLIQKIERKRGGACGQYYSAQISDLSAPLQGKGIADCNTFAMYAEILAPLKRRETNRERFSPRSLISLAAETGKKQREEGESMPKCAQTT